MTTLEIKSLGLKIDDLEKEVADMKKTLEKEVLPALKEQEKILFGDREDKDDLGLKVVGVEVRKYKKIGGAILLAVLINIAITIMANLANLSAFAAN